MTTHEMKSQDHLKINILLDYNFIVKKRNHLSYCNHENLALHIDAVNLADGDYELVPRSLLPLQRLILIELT